VCLDAECIGWSAAGFDGQGGNNDLRHGTFCLKLADVLAVMEHWGFLALIYIVLESAQRTIDGGLLDRDVTIVHGVVDAFVARLTTNDQLGVDMQRRQYHHGNKHHEQYPCRDISLVLSFHLDCAKLVQVIELYNNTQ